MTKTDPIREAGRLLDQAATAFLEQDGGKLAPADPRDGGAEFLVAWMIAMHEAKTLDRYDLEEIFSNAEGETSDGAILNMLSDIWGKVEAGIPMPHLDAYVGSTAEVTGDFSRIPFAKPDRMN